MTCEQFKARIESDVAFADEAPEVRRAMADHLIECAACNEMVEGEVAALEADDLRSAALGVVEGVLLYKHDKRHFRAASN